MLSEQEARAFQDRLIAAVGEHVKAPAWKEHLPVYARVCFHEAAHAVRAVELNVGIHRVYINPDEDHGRVVPRLISWAHSPKARSIIDAKISLAAPYAEDLFHKIDQTGIWLALHDLAEARFSLEYGNELAEGFGASMAKCQIPMQPGDLKSFQSAYMETRDRVLGSCRAEAIRSKQGALDLLAELRDGTKQWVAQRREILLETAVELARLRLVNGGRKIGLDGGTVERSIRKILRRHDGSG